MTNGIRTKASRQINVFSDIPWGGKQTANSDSHIREEVVVSSSL